MSEMESVENFRLRAREWISANLGPAQPWDLTQDCENDEEELKAVARDRALQRKLFDAGFAGLCFPKELGGQGLTPEHNRAFNEELVGHEYPSRFTVPTFTPCATVLMEFGTTEQKLRHVPAILKGDEFWAQMLSEPGGGSDVAGATTSAVRDPETGDWILNGSKVWTSRAWWHDYGIVLARTNWNVPKHQGLTVFIMKLQQPGVEIRRIERLNGESEACEEFMTDVRVPDSDRIGEIDGGWTVGQRWMFHERMGHNSPYVCQPATLPQKGKSGFPLVSMARQARRLDDPATRELIGESHALGLVAEQLQRRLASGAAAGSGNTDMSSVARLFRGMANVRQRTIAFEVAGSAAAAWDEEADGDLVGSQGMEFLMRQVTCIGGGTTEIARNVISERVLGMPREQSGDKGVPFRDVPRGPKRS